MIPDRRIIGPHSVPFGFRTLRTILSRTLDVVPMFVGPDHPCPGCDSHCSRVFARSLGDPNIMPEPAFIPHTARCTIDRVIISLYEWIPSHWQDQNNGTHDPRYLPTVQVVELGRIN